MLMAPILGNERGYFVRINPSVWTGLRAYLTKDEDVLDLIYQLYVPTRFVLGNFRERKGRLILTEVVYHESTEILEQYDRKNLSQEKIAYTHDVVIPEFNLLTIISQGRAYNAARSDLSEHSGVLVEMISGDRG